MERQKMSYNGGTRGTPFILGNVQHSKLMHIQYLYILTVNIECMWRGLETEERRTYLLYCMIFNIGNSCKSNFTCVILF